MFKKGDRVSVTDPSWSFGISKGKSQGELSHIDNSSETVFTVVQTGLSVMQNPLTEGKRGEYCAVCDVLITDGEGGFWFTQERFLKHVEPEIEINIKINGKKSTLKDISKETLLNIREQS